MVKNIVPTVGVLVFRNNEVLLVKHKEKAFFLTGIYGLPSGRVKEGEDEKDAAARELREETGLEVLAEELLEFPNNSYYAVLERKRGEVLNCSWRVFIARSFSGDLKESEETIPEWVNLAKLRELNLIPNVYSAIQAGLKFCKNSELNHSKLEAQNSKPKISIIAAITPERVIGKRGGGMLWHIPEDMRHFKETTTGHTVIMGRKTFETLGKPLPNRTNIVITRDENYSAPGCVIVHSLEEALQLATHVQGKALQKATRPSPEASAAAEALTVEPAGKENSDYTFFDDRQKRYNEVFVMGGGEIYEQAIGLADKLYLTLVHKNFEGDVFFPDYSEFKKEIHREGGESANGIKFTWLELEK